MTDNSNRLAGTAQFSVDGVSYLLAGDLTYCPTQAKRETLTGQDGVHGYKEMPQAPYIKAKLRDAGNLTVANFNAMTNSTVTCELANVKTVVGSGMWTVEAQEVETEDATFEVHWEGPSVIES